MRRTSIQQAGTATTTSALAEAAGLQEGDALVGIGDGLAHQVLAGDAEVRRCRS